MKKLLLLLFAASLFAGVTGSCTESSEKTQTTNQASTLDPKFNGVWQLCKPTNVNTEAADVCMAAPFLKIYNTDAGTFENIRMLPNEHIAKVTSSGSVADVTKNTYVENISTSIYNDVPKGTGIAITYEFVNDNTLKIKFTLKNASSDIEEVWIRVQ